MADLITEQEYQNAIIDLSAAKHVSLDRLIDETTPVSKWSLTFGALFSGSRLSAELQGIEGILNVLINKEGLSAGSLKIDDYGRWHFSEDQLARLRTLYRAQRLQSILDTIRKDQKIIDDYARQATIHPLKHDYKPLKNPPVVRTEDLMSKMKNSLRSQDKKLERIAAKAALKESKEKNREMLRRVSERSQRAVSHKEDHQTSQPNW